MDAGTATLLSGLTSGLIAGSIGALSAVLSYRMALKQAQRETAEHDKARRHQDVQMAIPKRLEAAETVWGLLFKLEHGEDLSAERVDDFVIAQMWLPSATRTACLSLLKQWQDTQMVCPDSVAKCRHGLIAVTGLDSRKEIEERYPHD